MTRLVVGCGYLGMLVARGWLDRGERVLATTRDPDRAERFRSLGLEPVVCDVTSPDSLQLPAVDTVVYCVGLDRSAGRSMREVYVQGLGNVLRHLPGSPSLVYVSSTSVFGQTDGEVVTENSPTIPLEDSGKVVLAAEEVLRQHDSKAIVLRFAGIYGPGRLLRERDLRAGKPLAVDAEKWLNLIHVEDGARAVLAACDRGEPGRTYLVSDTRPMRRREFYGRLAELLGAPPVQFVPPEAAEGASRRIDSSRSRAELGIALRFPTFEEGLLASLPKSGSGS